jgi:hypothetical protein
MINCVNLTFANFGHYAFHPLSKELSPTDQKIALIATLLLGLTLGIGHLICRLFFYDLKLYKINLKDEMTNEGLSKTKNKSLEEERGGPDVKEQINLTEKIDLIVNPLKLNEPVFLEEVEMESVGQNANDNLTNQTHLPNGSSVANEPSQKYEQTLSQKELEINASQPNKINSELLAYMANSYANSAKNGDKSCLLIIRTIHEDYPSLFNLEEVEQAHKDAIKQKIEENKKNWIHNPSGTLAWAIAQDSEYIQEDIDIQMYWYAEAAKAGIYLSFCRYMDFYNKNPSLSFDINQLKQAYGEPKILDMKKWQERISPTLSSFVAASLASFYEELQDPCKAGMWHIEAVKRGSNKIKRCLLKNVLTSSVG